MHDCWCCHSSLMVFITNNSRQRTCHFVGKSRELYKSCMFASLFAFLLTAMRYGQLRIHSLPVAVRACPTPAENRQGAPIRTSRLRHAPASSRTAAAGPPVQRWRAHEVVVRRRLTAQPGGSPGCLLQLCNSIGSPAPLWALALQP